MENENIKKLYIYIDESGTPSISDKDPFYIGVFVSTTKISTDFFDQSFQNLKNDEEFDSNQTDKTTYQRGYFHASLDSKNAHSYCCRTIAGISWPCEFYVSSIDKSNMTETDRTELNTEGKMHQHTLMISQMEFLIDNWDQIEIYIAERESSFSSNIKDQWEKEFVGLMGEVHLKSILIPVAIPELNIHVCGPDDTGVQICDFLLWAVQRKIAGIEDKWVKWSSLQEQSNYNVGGDPLSGHSFFLNDNIQSKPMLPLLEIPTEKDFENLSFKDAVIKIEKCLRTLYACSGKIKNKVIQNDFNLIMQNIIHSDVIEVEDVQTIVRIFNLIADEIPFYDPKDKDLLNLIYFCKKVCSEVGDKQFAKWLFRSKEWIKIRKENFDMIKAINVL